MDEQNKIMDIPSQDKDDLSRFTESYASFNRIINSLQRKYLELKEEFTAQNEKLAEANKKLVELSQKNITATEFLNGILNSISAGVIAVDQNGYITHFNPAASLILGIPPSEPLGRHYRDIIPPGEPLNANALRAAETGRKIDSVEKTIGFSDNSKLRLSVSTAILKDNEGRQIGAAEVFQDLTKIKKMENEIARLNTLAALGEMAATIAHEVRNPIAGIGGFAALLNRDIEDDDPKKGLIEKIIKGVNNLNVTIDTLLNYTRFEEIQKDYIEYTIFLKDTIEQFKVDNHEYLTDVNINLQISVPDSKNQTILNIDQMLFRQIFFNLFKNAIEASDYKGDITIHVDKLSRQKALELYADRIMLGIDETIVETKITDSGSGIDKEHMDKIFSPFFTTKAEGNGLGLAVAWKIVKTHGGDMMVENEDGHGAAFTILMSTRINNKQGEQ